MTAFEVGPLAGLEWLPWLLIGLPAGLWVDRSAKRPMLIRNDECRMVLIGRIPVAAARGVLTIGQLLAVGFAMGVATVRFQVAYQSYLPTIVAPKISPRATQNCRGRRPLPASPDPASAACSSSRSVLRSRSFSMP